MSTVLTMLRIVRDERLAPGSPLYAKATAAIKQGDELLDACKNAREWISLHCDAVPTLLVQHLDQAISEASVVEIADSLYSIKNTPI